MVGLTSGMSRVVMDITAAGMVVDMVEGMAVVMVDMHPDAVGMAEGMVTLALVVDTVVVVAPQEEDNMVVAAAVDMEAAAVTVVDMAMAVILELDIMAEVVVGTRSSIQVCFNSII